jgi:arylformamidase
MIYAMTKIIDISITLEATMPIWPGSIGFNLAWEQRLDNGDDCNNSQIRCDTHVGTHIDAPLHFIDNGQTADAMNLDYFIGPCTVIHLPDVKKITANQLSQAAIPPTAKRLLIRTDNSQYLEQPHAEFKKDFTALEPNAAQWIAEREVKLVGIDYLSIGRYENGILTHAILLEAGIAVLEGLNLLHVEPGNYELICMPLKIAGAEGAPARAALRKL